MPKYYSNGLELIPGITVGELNKKIMRNIYGGAFRPAGKTPERAATSATTTSTVKA